MLKTFLYKLFATFSVRKDSRHFIPLLQSHRGYCQPSTGLLENTLGSIKKAYELDYEMVEFDIRMTKDHKIILFHDDRLDRLKISSLSLVELQKKIKVDELEDVFKWYKTIDTERFKLNIEIKSKLVNGRLERAVYELIHKYKMNKNILISSFNPITLAYMNSFDKNIFRSLLLSNERGYGNNFLIKNMTFNFLAQPHALHLREKDWDKKIFKKLLEKKVPIVLWTCNDINKVRNYLEDGVSGIISDQIRPEQLS
jgi:glycerophosphoryl diester phosphodiesterase